MTLCPLPSQITLLQRRRSFLNSPTVASFNLGSETGRSQDTRTHKRRDFLMQVQPVFLTMTVWRQILVDTSRCSWFLHVSGRLDGVRSRGYRGTRVPCEEVHPPKTLVFHPPLSCFRVGFLFRLALPFQRCSAFSTGSAALVHDADVVVGRKTRNCRHKQPHRKRH